MVLGGRGRNIKGVQGQRESVRYCFRTVKQMDISAHVCIPAFGKLGYKDHEFETSLDDIVSLKPAQDTS